MKKLIFAAMLAASVFCCEANAQSSFRVEITNEGNTDFFTTPVWYGLHNGGFDLFDVGATASSSLEAIAEVGDVSGIQADFSASASAPGDIQGVVASPSGPPPIAPGETASSEFVPMNPVNYQYISFASMVVPTNDTFWGNADSMAYRIFDDSGSFLGTDGVFEILIDANDIYDAGTEINDATVGGGAAFAVGRDGSAGADENGVITLASAVSDLSEFANLETPAGTTIVNTSTATGDFARIRIVAVPEPTSLGLLGLGLGGVFLRRRRS